MKNILTQEEVNRIDQVCEEYNIENYTINSDGSIDVDGDVNLYKKGLDKLPLKFGKVSGHFYCFNNQLTSLEGCPSSISGNFHCSANNLTSLKGCSTSVSGDFYSNSNQLTSLEGCPSTVGGNFVCYNNELTSLKGCPSTVGGNFHCHGNNNLPLHFYNLYNQLSTLEFKIFAKYQHDLRIWDNNEYKEEEAQILYEEIKDGML